MPATVPRGRRIAGIVLMVVSVVLLAAAAAADTFAELETLARGPDPTPVALDPPSSGVWYCPLTGVGEQSATLHIAAAGDEASSVAILRHSATAAPETIATETIEPGDAIVVDVESDDVGSGHEVRWNGGPSVVTWVLSTEDAVAAPCVDGPSPTWYLSGFNTSDRNEAYLYLFNPFPSDAVARVRFATPEGAVSLTRTDAVPVEAGEVVRLDLRELQPQIAELGVIVETTTGRLVAGGQDLLIPSPGVPGRAGRSAVPAATHLDETWSVPWLRTDEDGSSSWLILMNPADREAAVRIVVTDPEPTEDALLSEMSVPAGGTLRVNLDGTAIPEEYSATVIVENDVPIGVSRVASVTTGPGTQGLAISAASPGAATGWAVAGLSGDARRGDQVVVLNPQSEPATVHVDAGDGTPSGWGGVELAPNERAAFPIAEAGSGHRGVLVRSDVAVVVGAHAQAAGDAIGLWSAAASSSDAWLGPATRPRLMRDLRLPTSRPPDGTAP